METTPNGIRYDYSLGNQGGYFIVYPNKNSESEILEAIKYIRSNRDVVSIRLAKFEDKVELFKSDLFRDKRTKHLKWFQINDEIKLLKKAVSNDWTLDYYIETFVIPFIQETEDKNKIEFGSKIYEI
jgi:hypothetical protein